MNLIPSMKPIAYIVLLAISFNTLSAEPAPRTADDGILVCAKHFYLLQADALAKKLKGGDASKRAEVIAKIGAVNADTFVLDQYYSNSPAASGLYTPQELLSIRSAVSVQSSTKKILCYFSVGEAENYRAYWNKAWDVKNDGRVDAGAPKWLLNQNPSWKGNYRVKYWDAEWQSLLMGSPSAPLDQIIAQGFDGVYLDIIDGFETFEKGTDNALNPDTGQTYRRDMIDFVKKIAAYARAKKPGFFVVPQNGSQLLDFEDLVQTISGFGQENLYYNGNKKNKPEEVDPVVTQLKKVTAAGKAVLVTDYEKSKIKQIDDASRAKADGFSLFIAPRELNGFGF